MRAFIIMLFVAKDSKQHKGSTLDLGNRGLCSGSYTLEVLTYHKKTKSVFREVHMGTLGTNLVLKAGTA